MGYRPADCVQIIGPITSIYRWQEKIETTEEWLCLIKSREDLYEQLEQTILEAHPYDVPKILAVPVVAWLLARSRESLVCDAGSAIMIYRPVSQ